MSILSNYVNIAGLLFPLLFISSYCCVALSIKEKKNYQKLYLSTFLETFSLLATQGITINRGAKLFDFTLRKFLQTKHLHCIIQNPAIVDIFF